MLDVQEVGEKSKFLIRVPSEVWLVVNLVVNILFDKPQLLVGEYT